MRTFWRDTGRGTVAAEPSNATSVVVSADVWGQTFAWPAEKAKVEQLEYMLEFAYERGRQAAKQEIRAVLGIKETPR